MLTQRRLAMEILALFCIGALVHLAVLQWVFPGFLDPLWPSHDDYYSGIEITSRSLTPIDFLWSWPRPLGFFFFATLGHLGVHGWLVGLICLMLLNCALAAALFRRIAGIGFGWLFVVGFVAYAFLAFSEPYFYIVYRIDVFMHISFFFLICGTWIFWRIDAKHPHAAIAIPFITTLLAFLCKETYGVTVLGLGFIWLLLKYRERGFWLAAAPGAAAALGLVLALGSDRLKHSPFTAGSGPYETNLHPLSVLHEVLRYAEGAVNPLTVAVLIAAAWLAFRSLERRELWLAVPICAVAAMLAWVPNALIPEHYSAGYAWSGAYILFLPVMLIAGQRRAGIEGRFSVAAILVAVVSSPLLFREAYSSSDNNWMLALEATQRNQLNALTDQEGKFPVGGAQQHILVTGINVPFTLFHLPEALHWIYPKFSDAEFDVVYYDVPAKKQTFGVKSISTGSVDPAPYTAVWAFNPDGTLRSAAPPPANWTEVYVPDIGLTVGDLLIYPELFDVFPKRLSGQGSDQGTAPQYYQCGTALLHYRGFALAEKCLSRAIELAPNNPYAYYFRGLSEEGLGKPDLARASYAKAIEQDNPKAPNPAFRQALARLDAAAAQPSP